MNFTAVILATYISLLTVQPVMTAVVSACNVQTEECCGDACCKHEQNGNKPTKQEQNGMCNPFQSCAYCCGYYIPNPSFDFVTVQTAQTFSPTVQDNLLSDFCADCFHPPEIV